jgi:hypothetical protein
VPQRSSPSLAGSTAAPDADVTTDVGAAVYIAATLVAEGPHGRGYRGCPSVRAMPAREADRRSACGRPNRPRRHRYAAALPDDAASAGRAAAVEQEAARERPHARGQERRRNEPQPRALAVRLRGRQRGVPQRRPLRKGPRGHTAHVVDDGAPHDRVPDDADTAPVPIAVPIAVPTPVLIAVPIPVPIPAVGEGGTAPTYVQNFLAAGVEVAVRNRRVARGGRLVCGYDSRRRER